MIGRLHRFHGYNSLRHVYQKGQTVRSPLLTLKFLPSRRAEYRVAVVVSRKVHKSAVVRNRIRRRMFEIVRQQGPQFGAPYDLVFTVFSEQVAELPHTELQKIIIKLLRQAGVVGSATSSRGIIEPKD